LIQQQKDLNIYSAALEIFNEGLYIKDLVAANLNQIQWQSIVSIEDPILLRIQKENFGKVIELLIMNGLGSAEPCALLQQTSNKLHAITSNAGQVAQRVRNIQEDLIYLLIADDLSPLKSRSLSGKTILVTRAKKQAHELSSLLNQKGARVIEIPAIEIVLRPEKRTDLLLAFGNIADFSWLILTSVNTVTILDQILREAGLNWNIFKNLQIACIGRSTAATVRERGVEVEMIPPLFQAESLAEELMKRKIKGKNILLPRAEGSRRILPELLEAQGARIHEIQIYRAEIPESSRSELIRVLNNERLDYITFTSSSTVNHFVEIAGELLTTMDFRKTRIACIGPVTAATLQEHGLPCAVQAKEFTVTGLVRALERDTQAES
jgi:uroporphyrinogen III methyltransferase/synthase